MRTFAAIVALAGVASAQSLSSGCQQTLEQIVASPDAACLNPTALVTLAVGSSSNSSVISPIDNWLSGLCSIGPCSNSTLSAIVTNVTSGCSSDLSSIGASVSSSSVGSIISVVQSAYPTVRQIVCLKDTSANKNCVTETLTNLQTAVGQQLSINSIAGIVTKFISGGASSIPSNVTCTDCIKQAYNIATKSFPAIASPLASPAASQCGSSFTDGASPSNIAETASQSSTSSTPGKGAGVTLFSFGGSFAVVLSGAVAISSGLLFLA